MTHEDLRALLSEAMDSVDGNIHTLWDMGLPIEGERKLVARLNAALSELDKTLADSTARESAAFKRGVKAMQKAAVALVDARASERRSTGNTYDDFIADSCDSIAHALRAMHPLPRDE